MWKAYMKGDAWVLSKNQDAYLWLLDRTGVYVGTLLFLCYVYVAVIVLAVLLAIARNENGFPIPPIYRPPEPCVTMEAKPYRGQVMTWDESCANGWRWKWRGKHK